MKFTVHMPSLALSNGFNKNMMKELLIKNRETILGNWFSSILHGYETYAVKFLQRTKDQFKNPVGFAIKKGITEVFDHLLHCDNLKDHSPGQWPKSLEQLVRIRAVQDRSPSKALDFVYLLKDTIWEVLGKEINNSQLHEGLKDFEKKIDLLALAAFDLYMEAREKLFQIKVMEIKSGYYAPHVYGGSLKCDNSDLPDLNN